MRILILSADTGGGHRSAAEAIAGALLRQPDGVGAQVEIVDYLAMSGRPLSRLAPAYSVVIHYPRLWRLFFRGTNGARATRMISGPAGGFARRAVRLAVRKHQPDVVVSVHPLATRAMTDAVSAIRASCSTVVVVTDMVTIHPIWAAPRASALVVATPPAAAALARYGVPVERVTVLGLPVDARFASAGESRLVLRQQLGWDAERFTVLLVGGGEGAGGMEEQVEAIVATGAYVQMAVVAGRNVDLYERIRKRQWSVPVHVYGFVRNMPDLMGASDLLLTKAGPGTISEALARALPMVITSALPGQEAGNVGYVVQGGAGMLANETGELATIVTRLSGPSAKPELAALSAAARRLAKPRAADDIARLILDLPGRWTSQA